MRIVQAAGFYYPDSVGGTEVYVESLSRCLQGIGLTSVVAAPSGSEQGRQYTYAGIDVFRYPTPSRWLRREVQGRVPPRYFGAFECWLYAQRADVYHQHSWTTGCGLWHLECARRLGLKTVVTLHVAGNVCLRGTMLHEGTSPCDGEIIPERCGSCWLNSKGLPRPFARALASVPASFGPISRVPVLGSALTARALALNRRKHLLEMFAAADRVVAVCSWLRDALLANGLPRSKLVLNRQGVGAWASAGRRNQRPTSPNCLRFGFIGRWDPGKGIHVAVEAFKRLPKAPAVEFHIVAAGAGPQAQSYRTSIARSAADDSRIKLAPELQSDASDEFLEEVDVLVVPSQWLETGPLVVLEAFAAGKPVLGSDLGGIAELVTHERNGLLVARADVGAWTAAMARLSVDRSLLNQLSRGMGPVRTMADVARDMAGLYTELFTKNAHGP